ncbi:hypothetical protein ACRYI5_04590 [Furfurilactobacillus sp. WILCCON 0119]|uniref:hypothetical protein n=1 Tax=Furfurilactobacillus entadae TaxID=2922307 RepID=UPI0035E7A302
MGSTSRIVTVIFVLVYAGLLYLVFADQNMLAMEVMALGMFAQAAIDCWHAFTHHTKTNED